MKSYLYQYIDSSLHLEFCRGRWLLLHESRGGDEVDDIHDAIHQPIIPRTCSRRHYTFANFVALVSASEHRASEQWRLIYSAHPRQGAHLFLFMKPQTAIQQCPAAREQFLGRAPGASAIVTLKSESEREPQHKQSDDYENDTKQGCYSCLRGKHAVRFERSTSTETNASSGGSITLIV